MWEQEDVNEHMHQSYDRKQKINATYRQVFIRGWVAAAADGVADVSGVAKRCIANRTLLMGEYIRVLINIAGVLSWKGWHRIR